MNKLAVDIFVIRYIWLFIIKTKRETNNYNKVMSVRRKLNHEIVRILCLRFIIVGDILL